MPDMFKGAGSGTVGLDAESFVDGGEILIGKLVGTLLGALWLTIVAGWMTLIQAIAAVHISLLNAFQGMIVSIITAAGVGGAETIRASWGAAFQGAVEVSPLFAPMVFSLEIVLVSALLIWARRRWT